MLSLVVTPAKGVVLGSARSVVVCEILVNWLSLATWRGSCLAFPCTDTASSTGSAERACNARQSLPCYGRCAAGFLFPSGRHAGYLPVSRNITGRRAAQMLNFEGTWFTREVSLKKNSGFFPLNHPPNTDFFVVLLLLVV